MTRDHKLALILGFVVFVAVVVMLGDHMSSASRAALIPTDGLGFATAEPEVDRGLISIQRGAEPLVPLGGPGLGIAPGFAGTGAGSAGQGTAGQGTVRQGAVAEPNEPVWDGPDWEARAGGTAGGTDDRDAQEPMRISQWPDPEPQRPPSVRPEPAARTYIVRASDTLSSICRAIYGDGALWPRLYAANRDRLPGGADTLREGVELVLPPKGVLTGTVSGSVVSGSVEQDRSRGGADRPEARGEREARTARAAPAPTPAMAPAVGESYRLYTVRSGDALSYIAQSELGTIQRIGEILDLNERLRDDPDRLIVGAQIRLPLR